MLADVISSLRTLGENARQISLKTRDKYLCGICNICQLWRACGAVSICANAAASNCESSKWKLESLEQASNSGGNAYLHHFNIWHFNEYLIEVYERIFWAKIWMNTNNAMISECVFVKQEGMKFASSKRIRPCSLWLNRLLWAFDAKVLYLFNWRRFLSQRLSRWTQKNLFPHLFFKADF